MLQDHPRRPDQLAGHRPDGNDAAGLGLLARIEALRQGVKLNREVGRLGKRPGEVFVTRLGVTSTFLFAVAG